jgi:hypothetical protein
MTLTTFLLWALTTYGIMFTLKYSAIAVGLRALLRKSSFFAEMLTCAFCTGFWSGIASGLLLLPLPCSLSSALLCVATGFAGATVAYAIDNLLIKLEGAEDG